MADLAEAKPSLTMSKMIPSALTAGEEHDHRAGGAESQRRGATTSAPTTPAPLGASSSDRWNCRVRRASGRPPPGASVKARCQGAIPGARSSASSSPSSPSPSRNDQRQRPPVIRATGNEEPAAAEHGRGAVVDGPAERSGEIGVDAERGDDPVHRRQQEGERVGAVALELLVEVVAPRRPDRDPAPAPRPTFLR